MKRLNLLFRNICPEEGAHQCATPEQVGPRRRQQNCEASTGVLPHGTAQGYQEGARHGV